jgi:DnaJ-class molecular chaperone
MTGLFTRILRYTIGRPPTPAEIERARALAVLELPSNATKSEIQSAYRRLCRKYHPDRYANDTAKASAAHELFVELHRAYKLLDRTRV